MTLFGWGGARRLGENLQRLGYRMVEPRIVAAADVGAPHRRARVFLLAWDLSDAGRERLRQLAEWCESESAQCWDTELGDLGEELVDAARLERSDLARADAARAPGAR